MGSAASPLFTSFHPFWLVDHNISQLSLSGAITGLTVFFELTPERPESMTRGQPPRGARTAAAVQSGGVARLNTPATLRF